MSSMMLVVSTGGSAVSPETYIIWLISWRYLYALLSFESAILKGIRCEVSICLSNEKSG